MTPQEVQDEMKELESLFAEAAFFPFRAKAQAPRGGVDYGDGLLRPCSEAAGELEADSQRPA
jgi:hypothetical protein